MKARIIEVKCEYLCKGLSLTFLNINLEERKHTDAFNVSSI